MNILIFYRNLDNGGVQRMMVNFANHMVSKSFNVTILLLYKEGHFLSLLDPKIKVQVLDTKQKSFLTSYKGFLKKGNFDIVFTATMVLNIVTIIAAKLARVKTKIIISERSNTFKEFKEGKFKPYKFGFFLIPIFYRFADTIVAVSKGVAIDLKKIALVGSEKIKVIYNPAFDIKNQYQVEEAVADDWLNDSQIPVVIGAGRFVHQKNFSLLVEAVYHLKKRIDVRLIIIGDGEQRADLQKLIADLEIQNAVKLENFKINPIAWISKADVFVLSSLWEGFGNILVDALAAQTTIVSTDCKSGPAEILGDGKYGYLVNSFNAIDLADKIEYAINNPIDKKLLLDRAMTFEKQNVMVQYENLIHELM